MSRRKKKDSGQEEQATESQVEEGQEELEPTGEGDQPQSDQPQGNETRIANPQGDGQEPFVPPETPQNGEIVFHCGHLVRLPHLLYTESTMILPRPDGGQSEAHWTAVCDQCMNAAGHKIGKVPIRGEMEWQDE